MLLFTVIATSIWLLARTRAWARAKQQLAQSLGASFYQGGGASKGCNIDVADEVDVEGIHDDDDDDDDDLYDGLDEDMDEGHEAKRRARGAAAILPGRVHKRDDDDGGEEEPILDNATDI